MRLHLLQHLRQGRTLSFAYAVRVAQGVLADFVQAQQRQPPAIPLKDADSHGGREPSLELRAAVRWALEQLPPDARALVWLHDMEGYTAEDTKSLGQARLFAPHSPLPPSPVRRGRGNAHQGAPPFAPTPLSHPVGEGLGVRAKTCAVSVPREPKCCALINTSRTCCAAQAEPCNNCQGCTLKQAKPALAAASVSQPALEWADVVLDAPALEGLIRIEPLRACFGLPAVRNHSPPLEPSAPRAPPLCCVR